MNIKNYDEDKDIGYILEIDFEYSKKLHNLHNDLAFLPEIMQIKKYRMLVRNLYDKKSYVAHVRTLQQALNDGLILKKVHRVIQFNQKAWLK